MEMVLCEMNSVDYIFLSSGPRWKEMHMMFVSDASMLTIGNYTGWVWKITALALALMLAVRARVPSLPTLLLPGNRSSTLLLCLQMSRHVFLVD